MGLKFIEKYNILISYSKDKSVRVLNLTDDILERFLEISLQN